MLSQPDIAPFDKSSPTASAVSGLIAGGPGFSKRISRPGSFGTQTVSHRMKPRSRSATTSKPSVPV